LFCRSGRFRVLIKSYSGAPLLLFLVKIESFDYSLWLLRTKVQVLQEHFMPKHGGNVNGSLKTAYLSHAFLKLTISTPGNDYGDPLLVIYELAD